MSSTSASPPQQTHKALLQTSTTQPPTLSHVPTPHLTPATALIRISHAPILHYTKYALNGTLGYAYPVLFIPGANSIGRITALGNESTALHVGDLVYIDCVVCSRDAQPGAGDVLLIGVTEGATSGSKKMMREVHWRGGVFQETVRVGLENVYKLDEGRFLAGMSQRGLGCCAKELTWLGWYLVPYGGLRGIEVAAGETLVATPATGTFRGAAVAVELAMGAACVVVCGRDGDTLERLRGHFRERVRIAVMRNESAAPDAEAIRAAASPLSVDAAIEISPPAAGGGGGGGGGGMGGAREDYPLPLRAMMRGDLCLKGEWMYERKDVWSLIRMVETGLLEIGERNGVRFVGEYPLEDWEEAIEVASGEKGWDNAVVFKMPN